jgi:tetratricopeptide (TPR) repeat protein
MITTQITNVKTNFDPFDMFTEKPEQTTPYETARQYFLSGDYKNMEKYALLSGTSHAYFNLGLFYETVRNDSTKAKNYYLMATENGDALCRLGLLYKKKNNIDLMLTYYNDAIKRGNIVGMYYYGLYCKDIKSYDLMDKYFMMALIEIEKRKISTNIAYNIGISYGEINDIVNMIKCFILAINIDNKCQALYELGLYYENNGEYEKMTKYFELYLESYNNKCSNILYKVGSYYEKIGNYTKMDKYFVQLYEYVYSSDELDDHKNNLCNIGTYYYLLKRYDFMEKFYLKSIELNSDHAEYCYGIYLDRQKDFEKAWTFFKSSASKGNKDARDYISICAKFEETTTLGKIRLKK